MLTEGAGELDASAYQERLSELGAALTFAADRDTLVGRLEAVRDSREQTFELLRLALTRPRFDAEAVERVRKSRLAELARLETDPNYVARRAWWQGVFPDHPYGRDPEGTEADIAAITADDLRIGFHEAYQPRGTSSSAPLAPSTWQNWRSARPRLRRSSRPGHRHRHSSCQCLCRQTRCLSDCRSHSPPVCSDTLACDRLRRTTSRQSCSTISSAVGHSRRGCSSSSERNAASSTPSVRGLKPLSDETLMSDGSPPKTTKFRPTSNWYATNGSGWPVAMSSEADVDAAKAFLKGALPLALDGTSTMAARLLAVQRLGLDMDHLTAWNAKIDAVTVEMVRALARRLMRPDALTFAIAGDPTGL